MRHCFYTLLAACALFTAQADARWITEQYNPNADYQTVYPAQDYYDPPLECSAGGDYSYGQPSCMPVIHPLCQQPSCDSAPAYTCYDVPASTTPCYSSCDPCCNKWFNLGCGGVWGGFAEFLWLGLYGEQLDYGAELITDFSGDPTLLYNSEILEHQFNWRPGVRLGVFYQAPNCGPDFTFEWFYYRNSNSAANVYADVVFNQVNSVYLFTPIGFNTVGLESDLSFRINHFTLKYGVATNWNENLSFHPYVGPVYYQTNEDLSVAMESVDDDDLQSQQTRINTQLRGIGAKVGMDMSYRFLGDFELVGDVGFTGVAGRYSLNRRFSSIITDTSTDIYIDGINKWTARAILDLSIGFRYTTAFCGGYLGFAQIEWEYHQLFDQTAFLLKDMSFGLPPFGGNGLKGFTKSNADLIIHGLSVGVGVAF